MSRFILDCAVQRPVDDLAVQWLGAAARRCWANPTAGYHEGRTSSALLEQSATAVAQAVGAGGVAFAADVPTALRTILEETLRSTGCTTVATCATDPLVVHRVCSEVAAAHDAACVVLPVDSRGHVPEDALETLDASTVVVTALANQEMGVTDTRLARHAARAGSRLILEATAGFGWVDLPDDWTALVVDPRAWGAPAGSAVLATRGPAGTSDFDNVAAAVTAGLAAERWVRTAPAARAGVTARTARIAEQVAGRLDGVQVHGGGPGHAPHILSISVLYVDAEVVQTRLDARGYAVGSGSACASRTGQPSHVLAAIGGLTSGNVRLGLPPDLPGEAVDGFIDALVEVVGEVRAEMGTQDL